ncbi:MAG: metallophosphoesterase family protein [Limisphaerales bacterium]
MLVITSAWAGPPVDGPRIAFLSDTHVRSQTNAPGRRFNRHLDQAIAEVNTAGVDLVLITGDLTENGSRQQMDLFKHKVEQFKAPVMFIPGNHDVGMVDNARGTFPITHRRLERYRTTLGENWFAREQTGIRVVGINSCLFGSGLKEEQEQWKFLEKELDRPRATRTLLLEHYPLFIKTIDEPKIGHWNVRPELRNKLLVLIKQAGVTAVLSGHLHYPITNQVHGTLFLGNGAVSGGLPRGKQPAGWMLLSLPRDGAMQFEFRQLN